MAKSNVDESSSSPNLSGQVAIITGAGRGSGRATAFQLARSGASLFLSDIEAETLEETLTDLKSQDMRPLGASSMRARWLKPNVWSRPQWMAMAVSMSS